MNDPKIPDLPAIGSLPPELQNLGRFLGKIRELVQTRDPVASNVGDELDKFVSRRELTRSGLTYGNNSFSGVGAGVAGAPGQPGQPGAPGGAVVPDLTPPPTPSGLTVTAGLTYLYIGHDTPAYSQGHGHDRTIVYGAKWPSSAPIAPTFSNAVRLMDFQGTFGAYPTEPSTRWCIWIKWQSIDGVLSTTPAGGANGAQATTGVDVSYLLQALKGQITESELYAGLGGSFAPYSAFKTWDFSSTAEGWIASGATLTTNGESIRISSVGIDPQFLSPSIAIAGSRYDKLRVRVRRISGSGWDGEAFYTTGGHMSSASYVKAIADTTILNSWVILEWDMAALTAGGSDWTSNTITGMRIDLGATPSDVFDIDWVSIGRRSAAVSFNTVEGLEAQYTVKLDVNGYVSGYGIASSPVNGVPFSSFIIRADSFAIAAPNGPGITPAVPFIVRTTAGSVNGVAYPAGVYIDAAYILDLTAPIARLGTAWIDDAKVANLSAAKLTAGDGTIGGNLKSSNYVSGTTGWLLRPDGYIEARTGVIGGTIIQNNSIAAAKFIAGELRTSNYSEDGAGTPTAGAKLDHTGIALKVAPGNLQVGVNLFTDYWFRLVQAIDGSVAGGRVIWRGNNDTTMRGGAPNIDCFSIFLGASSQNSAGDAAQYKFQWALQPTTVADNLDSMRHAELEVYTQSGTTPVFVDYATMSDRLYYSATSTDTTNASRGQMMLSWKPGTSQSGITFNGSYPGTFSGHIRGRVFNAYGPSAYKWFHGSSVVANAVGTLMLADYTPPAGAPAAGGGGGGGSAGGACPAPWVKVMLHGGTEIEAGMLVNGMRVAAVHDMTLESVANGGVIEQLQMRWAERLQIRLTDGRVSEWSANHRFYVVDRGWTALKDIAPGDHIAGPKESIVESIIATGEAPVVSFTVKGAGTYFGAGLLCHNLKIYQP